MKNKIELKKTMIFSVIAILIFASIFIVLNCYEYRKYTLNYNNKLEQVVSSVLEKYPNVDKNEMMEILNDKDANKVDLKEYGIDIAKEAIILENDSCFHVFLVINTFVIVIASISLIIIFLRYNSSKDKELEKITRYIEDINNGIYSLDIEDNTEDELSILKNELYKTTVMLKEIAQNSMQDKINLKDSLSDISHQLKTPLTSIVIMLDNILDDPYMDKNMRTEFLKDIKKEIVSINFLVNSILKLSKLDANSVNFINKDERIKSILNESIDKLSTLCDLKNIKINIEGKEDTTVYCDFRWQVEAITNILKNCVEHSKENSHIDISFEENKLYTKIEIRDYGVGIEKSDLPHIFERFYKGKNSSEDSIGIGLALAKAIIEKNNGNIDVSSEVNKGTSFIIKYFLN